ncbi:MAG: hypothetical protein IJD72_07775 [Alistipes sp.]|nr:hypothetical protein [Alistipes sp.]
MKRAVIMGVAALIAAAYIAIAAIEVRKQQKRLVASQQTVQALMVDVERYRTSDSLNAAKAGVLTLRLSEMERYRAEDMKLIESLRVKKRELEQVTSVQMQTIAALKGQVRDSVVVIHNTVSLVDSVQVLDVSDEWIDLHGVICQNGDFDGTLEVRDSLLIVETVQRKRFLGFLWRTKHIKGREIDVVSKSPYTSIIGVESILIDK